MIDPYIILYIVIVKVPRMYICMYTKSESTRLEHIMLFFLPIILFRNSSYFNLLFPYYHLIILTNLVESMHKIALLVLVILKHLGGLNVVLQ